MKVKELMDILEGLDPNAEVCRYQWNDLDASESYEYVEFVKQVTTTLLPDGTAYNEVYIGCDNEQ